MYSVLKNGCHFAETAKFPITGAVVTRSSYHYGLGSTPTPSHMWDVFHPSQPMPGGFPLRVFFHPQKGSKLF